MDNRFTGLFILEVAGQGWLS